MSFQLFQLVEICMWHNNLMLCLRNVTRDGLCSKVFFVWFSLKINWVGKSLKYSCTYTGLCKIKKISLGGC